jgi:hypothetical protein
MIQTFLESLDPDVQSLLADVSKHMTDEMLAEIALADYGQGQEKHLTAMKHLRDTGAFVQPMYWYPCEVLELARHADPERHTELQDHWIRVFACAALLRAEEEPWNYGAGGKTSFNLILLIMSIRALPIDFTFQAVRMVAWKMSRADLEGQDEQVIYCGVGLLWLTLHLDSPPPDENLIEIAAWIVRREAEIHKSRPRAFDRWLLGIGHDPPPSPWERLGEDLSQLHLGSHQRELQDWVKLIGNELSGKGLD